MDDKEKYKKLEKFTKLKLQTIEDGIIRSGPDFIRIGVCEKCNFNCVMCWHHSDFLKNYEQSRIKDKILDRKIILRVINEAEDIGVRGILFSGAGEPFLHPDMMKFLAIAKEKGFRVRIQTNLSLVKDPLDLAHLNIDVIAVNLCAATPETYVITHPNQKKKEFNKILSKIQKLIDNVSPDTEIRMTNIITKMNYKEIGKMFELSYKMNATLHLELADHSKIPKDKICINNTQKQEILSILNSLDKKYINYKKTNIKDFREQLKYSGAGLKCFKSCLMGYLYSFINEKGNVYLCNFGGDEMLMGNLYEQPFINIWNSEKYNKMRKNLYYGITLSDCQECLTNRGCNFKTRFFIDPNLAKQVLGDLLKNR